MKAMFYLHCQMQDASEYHLLGISSGKSGIALRYLQISHRHLASCCENRMMGERGLWCDSAGASLCS